MLFVFLPSMPLLVPLLLSLKGVKIALHHYRRMFGMYKKCLDFFFCILGVFCVFFFVFFLWNTALINLPEHIA